MVSAARAMELLEAAGGSGGDVTTIRLSNKSFGQDAAEIMAEKLRSVKTLYFDDIDLLPSTFLM